MNSNRKNGIYKKKGTCGALDGHLRHSGRRKNPQNTFKNEIKLVCVCVDVVEDAAVGFMQ